MTRRYTTRPAPVTDRAIGKHTATFTELELPPADDHNRRVPAVPTHLEADPKLS